MRFLLAVLFSFVVLPALPAAEPQVRYLPADTRMTLTIHVPALGKEDRDGGEQILRRLFFGRLAVGTKPGPSPWADLSRVVLAWPHAGTLSSVIVLRGKIDRKRFETQMREAMKAGKGLTVEEVGKPAVAIFRRTLEEGTWLDLAPQLAQVPAALRKVITPQEVYAAALDDETLFFSLAGKTPVLRALRARPATTAPRTTEALTALLSRQNPRDIAAFALLDDALSPALALAAEESTRETFEQFEHVTARIEGGKQVGISIQLTGKSSDLGATLEKKARTTLTLLEKNAGKLMPEKDRRAILEGVFRSLKVSRKEAVVTITGQLDAEAARKLIPAGKK